MCIRMRPGNPNFLQLLQQHVGVAAWKPNNLTRGEGESEKQQKEDLGCFLTYLFPHICMKINAEDACIS